jgi:hypothetical protein
VGSVVAKETYNQPESEIRRPALWKPAKISAASALARYAKDRHGILEGRRAHGEYHRAGTYEAEATIQGAVQSLRPVLGAARRRAVASDILVPLGPVVALKPCVKVSASPGSGATPLLHLLVLPQSQPSPFQGSEYVVGRCPGAYGQRCRDLPLEAYS